MVEIQRFVLQAVVVDIEAKSFLEARDIALEQASDIDFSGKEKSADYGVDILSGGENEDCRIW